jgi:nucleoside-diphosphate-sugar epimerase
MRIAIIGSTGFLGFNLSLFLNDLGYDLTLFGRNNHIKLQSISFNELKIREEENFAKLLEFDIIINAIGSAVQSNIIIPPNEIYDINLNFPIRLINYLNLKKFEGKLFTFGSYFEIGDEKENKSYSEIELVNSKNKVPNDYCVSKKLLSQFISLRESTINHLHLILPHIYGENETDNRLLPYLIRTISNNETPLLSSGEQIRQYLYIEDLCNILNEIFKKPYFEVSGFLNMPCYETCRIRDIIETVFDHLSVRIDDSMFGKLTGRDTSMKYLVLNSERYFQLGLPKPNFSIKNNINKYLNV